MQYENCETQLQSELLVPSQFMITVDQSLEA